MVIGRNLKLALLGLALTPALAHAGFDIRTLDVKSMALTAGRHSSRAILGAAMRWGMEVFAEKHINRDESRRDFVHFAGALSTYILPVKINKLVKLGDDNRTGTIAYAAGYMLLPIFFEKAARLADKLTEWRENFGEWRRERAREAVRQREAAARRRNAGLDSDDDEDEAPRAARLRGGRAGAAAGRGAGRLVAAYDDED